MIRDSPWSCYKTFPYYFTDDNINKLTQLVSRHMQCSICRGLGGAVNPHLVPLKPPKLVLPAEK